MDAHYSADTASPAVEGTSLDRLQCNPHSPAHHFDRISREGELNVQSIWSGKCADEGKRSSHQRTPRYHLGTRRFRPGIRKRSRNSKAVCRRSGPDRSRTESAMGEIPTKSELQIEGCSNPQKTDDVGSGTEEDSGGPEGEMGTDEGGEEDGLMAGLHRPRWALQQRGRRSILPVS